MMYERNHQFLNAENRLRKSRSSTLSGSGSSYYSNENTMTPATKARYFGGSDSRLHNADSQPIHTSKPETKVQFNHGSVTRRTPVKVSEIKKTIPTSVHSSSRSSMDKAPQHRRKNKLNNKNISVNSLVKQRSGQDDKKAFSSPKTAYDDNTKNKHQLLADLNSNDILYPKKSQPHRTGNISILLKQNGLNVSSTQNTEVKTHHSLNNSKNNLCADEIRDFLIPENEKLSNGLIQTRSEHFVYSQGERQLSNSEKIQSSFMTNRENHIHQKSTEEKTKIAQVSFALNESQSTPKGQTEHANLPQLKKNKLEQNNLSSNEIINKRLLVEQHMKREKEEECVNESLLEPHQVQQLSKLNSLEKISSKSSFQRESSFPLTQKIENPLDNTWDEKNCFDIHSPYQNNPNVVSNTTKSEGGVNKAKLPIENDYQSKSSLEKKFKRRLPTYDEAVVSKIEAENVYSVKPKREQIKVNQPREQLQLHKHNVNDKLSSTTSELNHSSKSVSKTKSRSLNNLVQSKNTDLQHETTKRRFSLEKNKEKLSPSHSSNHTNSHFTENEQPIYDGETLKSLLNTQEQLDKKPADLLNSRIEHRKLRKDANVLRNGELKTKDDETDYEILKSEQKAVLDLDFKDRTKIHTDKSMAKQFAASNEVNFSDVTEESKILQLVEAEEKYWKSKIEKKEKNEKRDSQAFEEMKKRKERQMKMLFQIENADQNKEIDYSEITDTLRAEEEFFAQEAEKLLKQRSNNNSTVKITKNIQSNKERSSNNKKDSFQHQPSSPKIQSILKRPQTSSSSVSSHDDATSKLDIEYMSQYNHLKKISSYRSSLYTCSGCHLPIEKDICYHVPELNSYWHQKCFRCSVCHSNLIQTDKETPMIRVLFSQILCQNCSSNSKTGMRRMSSMV
ncbi:probable WRKY transcription factor protein 1 [Xenia sp. Carnegie-2017]|uniref:probable WRKY transcription factor protein 1 n=1 Tax=Xenia sp. Carnegie-2017 TaxID=2897299 RepID=UPI001F047B4A|nr:probable WRKY transcription factor protein 1 [Xenia sp. Carnegie-2017]